MPSTTIYCGDMFDVWPRLDAVADLALWDAPYSSVTCEGHNVGMATLREGESKRGMVDYAPWAPEDVERFCRAILASGRCRGWCASLSDDVLGPWWRHHFAATAGLYAFAGVPCIVPGSRFRKTGDGPPCESYLLYAARPKLKQFIGGWSPKGHYIADSERRGHREPGTQLPLAAQRHIRGEKPVGLMVQIVRDYLRHSTPGREQLVLDPCCGRGSTLIAAHLQGHRSIGIERCPETFEMLQEHLWEYEVPFTIGK